jgi:acid stress chaperone HdeA
MRNKLAIAALCAMVAGASPVLAQSTIAVKKGVITTTRTETKGKKIEQITCREFLGLRDRFQPQAVSYLVGYTKAHRPEDAVFEVSGVDRLTPVIIKTCQTRPQETLLQRIKDELKRF